MAQTPSGNGDSEGPVVAHTPVDRVTVLGAGSWGTTFGKILADAGRKVTIWARRPEIAYEIRTRHTNSTYLPGIDLPDDVDATTDPEIALSGAEAVVLALPSQRLRENLTEWRPLLPTDSTLVSLAKGVELDTLQRMSQVISEVAEVDGDQVVVVSGPNLAEEIAQCQPAAAVVACTDHDRAVAIQQASFNSYFRTYSNTDVVGCELGGACKNVMALACGMASGLGYGINTTATIITRGLAETARLGSALGADPLTFAGLAGVGDLVATCSSPLSRNRTFGERIGRGETVDEARRGQGGQVAEGVTSCRSIRELARTVGVELPITDAMYRVCHEGLDPALAGAELLGRRQKHEWS